MGSVVDRGSPSGFSPAPDTLYYWNLLFLFGFHVLRGIFFSQYVTRFITAFLVLSVPNVIPNLPSTSLSPNASSTTAPLTNLLHTGKGIALFSFIHMHVQYMFVAVVKDSLPAWKAAAFSWLRQYLPQRCCPTGGGSLANLFASVKAFFQKIPCISGVLLTLFMCLLWVPLENLAGLAIYCKVVLSCYTLFLIVEDSLPTSAPALRTDSLSSGTSTSPFNVVPKAVDSPVPHIITTTQKVSRRTSPSHSTVLGGTPLNNSANASTSSIGRARSVSCTTSSPTASRRHSRSTNNSTSSSTTESDHHSIFSVWWVCEILAGLGATAVTVFADIGPSSQFSLAPILMIILIGGGCFIAGMYASGVHSSTSHSPFVGGEQGVGSVTIIPVVVDDLGTPEVIGTPPVKSLSTATNSPTVSQNNGRASSHISEEVPTRTFKEFALASLRTFKRPSMQAMTVVLGVVILYEALFQQYFLIILLAATPPGVDLSFLHYCLFPLGVLGVWIGPLLFGPLLEIFFSSRCPYAMGSLGLSLLGMSGVVLVILGLTAAVSIEPLRESSSPSPSASNNSSASPTLTSTSLWFSERVFFLFLVWIWCFTAMVGGFRRAIQKLMVPTVINEDKVIFGRGINLNSRQERAEDETHSIVEEIFKLVTLLARSAATILGCLFFWIVPMTAYGDAYNNTKGINADSPASSSVINNLREKLIPFYCGQLRKLTVSIGLSVLIIFSITLLVWRKFYRLYGHHKAFIDSSCFTA